MDEEKWRQAKMLVRERDGNQCLRCFGPADEVHHRAVRGMGGSGDDEVNYGPANLICLCRGCHDHVHSHPGESYENGFLVQWWNHPERTPLIVRPGLHYVMLTKQGDAKVTHLVLPF